MNRVTAGLSLALLLSACPSPSDESTDASDATPVLDVADDPGQPDSVVLPDPGKDTVQPPSDVPEDEGPELPADVPIEDAFVDLPPDVPVDPDVPELDVPPPLTFPMSCASDADCAVACGSGECLAGTCTFTAPQAGCVIVDDGVGMCVEAGVLRPGSNCLFCNPDIQAEGWTPSLTSEEFEDGKGDFIISNLSGSPASWSVSGERAASGTRSLYFGEAGSQTYDVGVRAWARVTSKPLLVPTGVSPTLSFALWLETEQTVGYDFLRVVAMGPDGHEHELWHSDQIGGSTAGEFVPFSLALDPAIFAGQVVQFAFEFDSVDGLINMFEGAYLDSVVLATGCCDDENHCDDGDPCTEDQCGEDSFCTHDVDAACCHSDIDCDDDNVCTTDSCSGFGGTCQHESVPDCCFTPQDCDDGDPCTEDSCNVAASECIHQPLCCTYDSQCDDGDKCTAGSCVEGQCAYEFLCCLSDGECDDGDYCTLDQCVDGDCVHEVAELPGCCNPQILTFDFDTEGQTSDWVFSPLDSGVGWQVVSMSQAQSAPAALYYGDPTSWNFNSGGINSGTATSGPIDLPEGIQIALEVKIFIDAETSSYYDKFWLDVKTPNDELEVISKSQLTNNQWKSLSVDLSYLAGQTIQLEFNFNTIDGTVNQGLGVVVDDLKLVSTCEPKTCTSNSQCPAPEDCTAGVCEVGSCVYVNNCCSYDDQCDDGLVCTNDTCASNSKCSFQYIAGCCESDANCNDNDICTIDYCTGVGGSCVNEEIPGCCVSPIDCDDQDGCTLESCVDNFCDYTWICCASDEDCDDGDDVCTNDSCVDSFCAFAPTGVEGCCEEAPIFWDFETPVSFDVWQNSPPCSWQIAATPQAASGSQTLYYGNPGSFNFSCGDNAGTATSDPISLLPGVDYQLEFLVYMDTESSTTYDKLWVYAVIGGQEVQLWDKSQLGGTNTWHSKTVDLSAFAGQTFALKFEFDSIDSVSNSGMGALIDDLSITSNCIPKPCATNGDCNDGLSASTDTCSAGACIYSF